MLKTGPLDELMASLVVLPELRRRFREAHITLITGAQGISLLSDHPWLDRVLPLDAMTAMRLTQEQFELTINLDMDVNLCALQMALFAHRRWGIGLCPSGLPIPLSNEAAALMPWLLAETDFQDTHALSYMKRAYRGLGLDWRGDRLMLPVDSERRDQMMMRLAVQGFVPGKPTVAVDAGLLSALTDADEAGKSLLTGLTALMAHQPDMQWLMLAPMQDDTFHHHKMWGQLIEALKNSARINTHTKVFQPRIDDDPRGYLAALDCAQLLFCAGGAASAAALGMGKRFLSVHTPQQTPCVEAGEQGAMLALIGNAEERVQHWLQVGSAMTDELLQNLNTSATQTSTRSRAA